MTINYEEQHFDVEEEGRCNLVLVAVRYTGSRSSVPAHKYRTEAAWPGHSPFQTLGDDGNRRPGAPQLALLPDWTDEETENRTVESFESDPNMEVYYRPEEIAKALLEKNYLDPNVFGRGYDDRVRQRVFDQLGISYEGTDESTFRAELREIAGIEADEQEVKAEARDDQRVSEYRSEHPRSDLVDAARILGYEDPDAAGKIELATWLADQDPEAVRYAFDGQTQAARDTNAGEDVEVEDPLTAEDVLDTYEKDELKDVVKSVREGPGEISLRSGAEGLAEWLVDTKGLTEDQIDAALME